MARKTSAGHAGVPATSEPSGVTVEEKEPHEPWLNSDLSNQPDLPSEMAQEVWEALKEEFYEQIEQLPLSLHRSFALIGEQDKEIEACRAELLPTIRSYVKLRQSLSSNLSETHPQESSNSLAPPHGSDMEAENAGPDVSAACSEETKAHHEVLHTQSKRETVDVNMHHVSSKLPACSPPSSLMHTSQNLSEPPSLHPLDPQFASASARTLGLRESDASVPKSVPFPPRQKPKTTRELLTRISFLMREVLRASEEKIGLATAVYDSVDRHVRVLDTAIKKYEVSATPGLGDGTGPVGLAVPDVVESSLNPTGDDDEPQLGMIGPSGNMGGIHMNTRRSKKSDRRKHALTRNSTANVNALPPAANHELPIDPHEPRYCYCNQVSYGEMIACDNPDCSREWFHLGCAGLSAPPKSKIKWYCRECEEALGRNKRRRIR